MMPPLTAAAAMAAGVAATGSSGTGKVATSTRAAGPTMRGGDTMGNTAERGGHVPKKEEVSGQLLQLRPSWAQDEGLQGQEALTGATSTPR